MDIISVPLKKPSDVDIVNPLKNLIQSRYSTADKPEDYSDAINELAKLRSNALWRAFEKYESSLEVLYCYYDQLVALEGKIPPHDLQVPFKWKDAMDKGSIFGSRISLTVTSLSYEKICVLFNIAALQSSVAASQSIENDEGLKLAAKLLQQSSGIFNYLKSIVILSIQQEPTPDLNPDTLAALAQLMLAQAQEIFVHKCIHDNKKDAIIAKLAACCEDLYTECVKIFNKEQFKGFWDKEWLMIISAKQASYQAIANLYQSLVCKENKAVGEEITWLTSAEEQFKISQQRLNRVLFQDLWNKAQRNLVEAKKDNDFIYHERIPDLRSLASIGKAQLAKMTAPNSPMSQNFKDLFDELVPVAVHQALAAHDIRRTDMVQSKIMKMRESTQMLNSILASLNLPAAVEVTEGNTLPPSLMEKGEAVRSLGGIANLEKMIVDLPELLKRNQEILNEADRMLNEERDADKALRDQFKDKWTRTQSDKLTEMFRSNITKYRQIINNAVQADKTVREKFDKHRSGMELLSKSPEELQEAVPNSADGSGNISDSSAAQKLRNLMEEVETVKAERDVIETELNSATSDMKAQFMSALASDGVINEPVMSSENLGKMFGPLGTQVDETVSRQESLIEQIQTTYSEFVNETGVTSGGRKKMMCDLAFAHDAFRDLQNNLKEGTKFYNELTELLLVFQNKISDYCFARKTEKEELLKDLTQESSRQAPAISPTQPTYHNTPAVNPQAPPAADPNPPHAPVPSAAQTNLPYPVYVQHMPIPYGATNNTPYPSYAPPPMPQSYNPYGTMPYPTNYGTYPGAFPQYPQQHGQYPPGPPGYPGQPGQQPGPPGQPGQQGQGGWP